VNYKQAVMDKQQNGTPTEFTQIPWIGRLSPGEMDSLQSGQVWEYEEWFEFNSAADPTQDKIDQVKVRHGELVATLGEEIEKALGLWGYDWPAIPPLPTPPS
jgi:hypothetical protein